MAKQSQESKRSKIGRRAEVFSGSVDADFDAKASWKDVKLMVSPEEMSGKLKLVARHGPDIKTQAALLTNGERDPFAISGLLALSHWLASRIIQGPKVRSGLRRLVQWEVSELAGKSLGRRFAGFLVWRSVCARYRW